MDYFLKYWLPSLITLIPSLIAFSSLIYQIWHGNKIDKETNQRLEKEQASLISVWQANEKNSGQIISNNSKLPAYNLYVFMCYNQDYSDLKDLLINVKNFAEENNQSAGEYFEIFPPSNSEKISLFDSSAMGNKHSLPTLLFTDTQNIQWYRHADGYLEKLDGFDYLAELQHLGLIFSYRQEQKHK